MMTHIRRRSWAWLAALLIAPAAMAQQAPGRINRDNGLKLIKGDPAVKFVFVAGPMRLQISPVGGVMLSRPVKLMCDDREITIELPVPTIAADEEKPPPRPKMTLLDPNTIIVSRDTFDRWLLKLDRGGEVAEDQGRSHLDAVLGAMVHQATLDHHLTDREQSKLRLAGRGDIKHLLDRVDAKRADFEAARKTLRSAVKVLRELDALSVACKQGPFGDESLFAKTLKKIDADRPPVP